jgi:hypothetical protein
MAIAAWEHAVSSGVVGPRPANSSCYVSPPTTPSRASARNPGSYMLTALPSQVLTMSRTHVKLAPVPTMRLQPLVSPLSYVH